MEPAWWKRQEAETELNLQAKCGGCKSRVSPVTVGQAPVAKQDSEQLAGEWGQEQLATQTIRRWRKSRENKSGRQSASISLSKLSIFGVGTAKKVE